MALPVYIGAHPDGSIVRNEQGKLQPRDRNMGSSRLEFSHVATGTLRTPTVLVVLVLAVIERRRSAPWELSAGERSARRQVRKRTGAGHQAPLRWRSPWLLWFSLPPRPGQSSTGDVGIAARLVIATERSSVPGREDWW